MSTKDGEPESEVSSPVQDPCTMTPDDMIRLVSSESQSIHSTLSEGLGNATISRTILLALSAIKYAVLQDRISYEEKAGESSQSAIVFIF